MVNDYPHKELQIKKSQQWELWLVSPPRDLILGAFQTLEELNQAQITLYQAWEKARYSQEPVPVHLRH